MNLTRTEVEALALNHPSCRRHDDTTTPSRRHLHIWPPKPGQAQGPGPAPAPVLPHDPPASLPCHPVTRRNFKDWWKGGKRVACKS